MNRIFSLILTALLLCELHASTALAADEPLLSTDSQATVTFTTTDDFADDYTATPSDSDTTTGVNEHMGSDEEELLSESGGSANEGQLISGSKGSSDAPNETEYNPVPDGFDYTGSTISFITPDAFSATFDMDCGDTGFTQLNSDLDSYDIYGTVEKDGIFHMLPLSVAWDFSTVDAETLGSYTALGSISIPEGATFSEGSENMISISVEVTSPMSAVSPSAITLTSFDEPDRIDAVAFAQGTSQEELSKWFADSVAGFIGYDVDGNAYDLISGAWSLEAVDTDTVGIYYASAAPELGEAYILVDGVSLPRQLYAVSIQTPGEPDINCCVSGRGFLHFPWVLSIEQQEQLDAFDVWLQQDTGEWTQLGEGFCLTSGDLQLSQRIFEIGSTYALKVTYPGGQTGVLSFQYDGELSIIDYSCGDRDGGDVNGDGSSSGLQPPPTLPHTPSDSLDDNSNSDNSTPTQDNSAPASNKTPDSVSTPEESREEPFPVSIEPQEEQTPVSDKQSSLVLTDPSSISSDYIVQKLSTAPDTENHKVYPQEDSAKVVLYLMQDSADTRPETISEPHEPAVVTESYSPTQTVISGLRLFDLCANEESVVFGSGDLTVSIPSNLLLGLNLTSSDTLSVSLTQPESNQIMLAVEASGKPIIELSGMILRLRYKPQSEKPELSVLDETGKHITDPAFDGVFLRFTADMAGTYTITEASKIQKAQKGVSPLFPLSGCLILAAGGITFFRRRHHG